MTQRTYRVFVRGFFDGLGEEQRAVLLADAPRHDFIHAAFTREGTLAYDPGLRQFTFRFEVDGGPLDGPDDGGAAAAESARAKAVAMLEGLGVGHRGLRTRTEDLSARPVPSRLRQRGTSA